MGANNLYFKNAGRGSWKNKLERELRRTERIEMKRDTQEEVANIQWARTDCWRILRYNVCKGLINY